MGDMKKHDVDVEAAMAFRILPTAQWPDIGQNLSSIGVGYADVPEAGGHVLMIAVVDGAGSGAIAMLDGDNLRGLISKLVEVGIGHGLLQAERVGPLDPAKLN